MMVVMMMMVTMMSLLGGITSSVHIIKAMGVMSEFMLTGRY